MSVYLEKTFTVSHPAEVSLLYYEPGTIAFLDRALSEQSLLEVPKARVRVDSKHAVSVEEATRLVRACQKLIVIGAVRETRMAISISVGF